MSALSKEKLLLTLYQAVSNLADPSDDHDASLHPGKVVICEQDGEGNHRLWTISVTSEVLTPVSELVRR